MEKSDLADKVNQSISETFMSPRMTTLHGITLLNNSVYSAWADQRDKFL